MHDKQTPVVAVDLGGTKILASVVSQEGDIISSYYCLTEAKKGRERVIKRLLSAVDEVINRAGTSRRSINKIGIAAPGLIDSRKGMITTSPNLPGWRNVLLQDIVSDEFDCKTFLVNDASAAALGEQRFGAGVGASNIIFLTVSTGIGGGIVIDGKLYLGADGAAGEIGHMAIEADGPECQCGNKGCLEALASGTAVARDMKERLTQGKRSSILDHVAGDIEKITAVHVASAAKAGDGLSSEVIAQAAGYLGIGLTNIMNIFNPEVIVIGGGLSNIGPLLLQPAKKLARERAFKLPAKTARIVRAKLGGNAGIVGAAAYAFDRD